MTEVYSPGTTTKRVTLTYQIQSWQDGLGQWHIVWNSSVVVEDSPEAEALLVEVHKRLDRLYTANGTKFRAVCKRWVNATKAEVIVPMWEEDNAATA